MGVATNAILPGAGQNPVSMAMDTVRSHVAVEKSDYLHAHVLTWNVAGNTPATHDIEALFLPQESVELKDLANDTDLLVVGLQEAYQNVQGAVSSSIPLLGRDGLVEAFSAVLGKMGFARVSYCRILGIVIVVLVKRPLLCYVREVETASLKTGLGGLLGNKGGVSVRMVLGDLKICFTNCHLVPHCENNDRRVQELHDILEYQFFDVSDMRILDHDVVVLFGDLNFRIEGKEHREIVDTLQLTSSNWSDLFRCDQLRLEQVKGRNSISHLHIFMEMDMEFAPSYKYKPETDLYEDEEKGRPPAWCDRVLWNVHDRKLPRITDICPQQVVKPSYYKMHRQPRISDHKPVCAGLKLLTNFNSVMPQVIFRLTEWVSGEKYAVEFDVMMGLQVSTWDWIGLYTADFTCIDRDSVFWVYAPGVRGVITQTTCYSRTFMPDQLSPRPGRYVWVYKSAVFRCVLGMSPVFRVVEKCS